MMSETILVLGNCSKIIFRNTVIGIHMIIPGIPQRNPQSINITNTVIIFMEKDLPMKIGSRMDPKVTCTDETARKNRNIVLVESISTIAKSVTIITAINEPTIWTKLIKNANSPQKIGKLTSKA